MPAQRTMISHSDSVPTEDGPLVSVVIRTYRGRLGFLREAVDSATGQTYRNLELVIVEDGTTDAEAFAAEMNEVESRRVVYRSIPKAGRCVAGNAGLSAASGEYAMFLDDDDLLFPDHVARLITPLLEDERLAASYSTAFEVPTRILSANPLEYEEDEPYIVYRSAFSREELSRRNFMAIQSVLFRRSLFQRLGGLREDLELLEDWDLWKRYATAGDFLLVDRVTSAYRVSADPESARQRQLKLYEARHEMEAGRSLKRWLRQSIVRHPWLYRVYWRGRQWYFRRKGAA